MERVTKIATTGEKAFIFFLRFAMLLYFIFIYQTVWNWFIADFLFPLTYLQMFIGVVLARFIFLPSKKQSKMKKLTEEEKNESFAVKLDDTVYAIASTTMAFGILFVARLIISYYGL